MRVLCAPNVIARRPEHAPPPAPTATPAVVAIEVAADKPDVDALGAGALR